MSGFAPSQYGFLYQGLPAASGTLYVYQTGTTTPVTIYSDGGLTTPISNPLTLDANGNAAFYVSGTVNLKLVAYTATGTLIQTLDPVYPVGGTVSPVIVGGTIDNAVIGGNTPAAGTFTTLKGNTPAQGDNSTSAATTAFVAQNNFGGFVNKFRNPQMAIAQRGTSGTITAGSPAYTLDGWIINSTGANVTWNQEGVFGQNPLFGSNDIKIIGNTSVTDTYIKQRIEGGICAALCNQQITVQCSIGNNSGSGITPTLTVKTAGSLDNWGSPTVTVNAVSLQTIPSASGGTLAYTFAAPNNASNGLEITFDFGSALNTNGKYVQLTNFDLRITPGVTSGINNAPPYVEQRPVSIELPICQRYFNSTFGNGNAPAQSFGLGGALGTIAFGTAAGEAFTQWNFPVQMRIPPGTVTTYNPSASNANWRDVTGSSDVAVSVNPDSTTGSQGIFIGSQTTSLTANHHLYIHATASAEL